MTNSIQYLDPLWIMFMAIQQMRLTLWRETVWANRRISRALVKHGVLWDIHKTITWFIGGIYSGMTEGIRYFSKIIEFIVDRKQVVIEQTWTGAGTASTFTLSITPSVVPLACLVVSAGISGSSTPTSMTWNGLTLVRRVNEAAGNGYAATAIYSVLVPAGSLGVTANVVAVGGPASTGYFTVFLLSGANQANHVAATGSATGSTVEPHSVTLTTSVENGLAIEVGVISAGAFGAVGGGQTPLPDSTTPYGSYKASTGASTVMTHTLTNALSRNSMAAMAVAPE